MGSDKAFLQFGDESLLLRALRSARSLTEDARIVGDANKFAPFGCVVEDVYRDRGPLGGIHAALVSSATEFNLVLAVDVPFVTPALLRFLLLRAQESTAIITVPRTARGLQPLCGVYRRSFAEVAERALREGRNKIDDLFQTGETRVVEEHELAEAGFWVEMFQNLNTPGELEKARVLHLRMAK
jgi:molybdopterin-guanine dinucleotide biosynthesis protein A